MKPIELPPSPRVLVIALRRLGDVLLATPLIRSVRRAWPDAVIDALVFAGTEPILEGNPDLDGIVVMPERPSHRQSLMLAARLWNRYAVAFSTAHGDRPSFFAWAAGQRSVGLVGTGGTSFLKRLLLDRAIPLDHSIHRVHESLRLAGAVGINGVPEVVAPGGSAAPALGNRYAVVHVAPKYQAKRWTPEGWRALAAGLRSRGLRVVATGGPDENERRYVDEVWDGVSGVRRLDGRLTWPELAALLANAAIYVGPDTSVTHLAAATGCPTVALFGPTDPVVWGPWPANGLREPWRAAGSIQHRDNVWLVPGPSPEEPCGNEGCESSHDSSGRCLGALPADRVLAVVTAALTDPTRKGVRKSRRRAA